MGLNSLSSDTGKTRLLVRSITVGLLSYPASDPLIGNGVPPNEASIVYSALSRLNFGALDLFYRTLQPPDRLSFSTVDYIDISKDGLIQSTNLEAMGKKAAELLGVKPGSADCAPQSDFNRVK